MRGMRLVPPTPRRTPRRTLHRIPPGVWRRLLALALWAGLWAVAPGAQAGNLCAGLDRYTVSPLIGGAPMDLCRLPARALLVVNTASACGFTAQYGGLETLHQRYKARGLQVVAVPANDFGGQEPLKNADIGAFCQINYGVSFPVTQKLTVPLKSDPLFARLAAVSGEAPGWNFHKYLITPDGRVASFASAVDPLSPRLTQAVDRALASPRPTPGP